MLGVHCFVNFTENISGIEINVRFFSFTSIFFISKSLFFPFMLVPLNPNLGGGMGGGGVG